MRNILYLMLFVVTTNTIIANEINFAEPISNSLQVINATSNHNKGLAILSFAKKYSQEQGAYLAKIDIYQNEKHIQTLKTSFEQDGKTDSIWVSLNSAIEYDQSGNLWVSGIEYVYCYNGEDWLSFSSKKSDDELILISKMVVDESCNVWVLATIGGGYYGTGQLWKISNSELSVIYEIEDGLAKITTADFLYPSISPYPGGGCIFSKIVIRNDIYNGEEFHQIVIAKPNNNISTFELKAIYNNYLDSINYLVGKIFVENENKIWFPLQRSKYIVGNTMLERFGGLTCLENGKWIFFDENNGFKKYSDSLYQPVNSIFKMKDDDYLLVSENELYIMDNNDYSISRTSWSDLFQYTTFYSYSDIGANIAYFENKYKYLLDTNIAAPSHRSLKMIKKIDDEFYIVDSYGVVKFSNRLVGVNDNTDSFKWSIIKQVECDKLMILESTQFAEFVIYDLLGNSVHSGTYTNEIHIGNLQRGLYFIKFVSDNDSVTEKFLKL